MLGKLVKSRSHLLRIKCSIIKFSASVKIMSELGSHFLCLLHKKVQDLIFFSLITELQFIHSHMKHLVSQYFFGWPLYLSLINFNGRKI